MALGTLLAGCGGGSPGQGAAGGFPDEAAARGLAWTNVCGTPAKDTVLEANGPGVAVLDLGNDGDPDLVFSQQLPDLAALRAGPGARLYVAENDGAGHFEAGASPTTARWWTGLATGDLDGDGDADLVAGAYGDLVLFRQDGRGELVEQPDAGLAPAGPGERLVPGEPRAKGAPAPAWTTSVAAFDPDLDGDLDLYAGRYLELDPDVPPRGEVGEGALGLPCSWKGLEVFCGPRGLVPQADHVYANGGDGSFTDASARWLPAEATAGYTLGVVPFDADGDGDADLYVAADSAPNRLFVNELGAAGRFAEHGLAAGVAVNLDGLAEAGMGVDAADLDRDGRMDLVVTNFSDEATQLYLGAPVGFTCASYRMGLATRTRRLLSWGVHLEDFDGDGRHELFTANGHVYPQADAPDTGTRYAQPDTLLRLGPEGFEPWPVVGDSVFSAPTSTRGSAVLDVDGDGAPDLALARLDGPAALGLNRLAPDARRLALLLEGPTTPKAAAPRTPRDAQGARVIVAPRADDPDGVAQLAEVRTARGYQSASTRWLHFGFGDDERHGPLTVLWPSGERTELPAGPTNRRLVVREGEGLVSEEGL